MIEFIIIVICSVVVANASTFLIHFFWDFSGAFIASFKEAFEAATTKRRD